jgi:hypothetical protein
MFNNSTLHELNNLKHQKKSILLIKSLQNSSTENIAQLYLK